MSALAAHVAELSDALVFEHGPTGPSTLDFFIDCDHQLASGPNRLSVRQVLEPAREQQLLDMAARFGWRLCGREGTLLQFERERRPAMSLRWIGPDDAAEVRRLFLQIFEHPLSEAEWAWKYADGRGVGVGLWAGDRLIAHYGGLERQVWRGGALVTTVQICDVMVAPDARAALARRGGLHQVTTTFMECAVGEGRRFLFGYGFPTTRAFAVARKLGLYEAADAMVRLSWPAVHAWPARLQTVVELYESDLAPGQPHAASIDRLWSAMRSDLAASLLPVRDAAWIARRYFQHPTRRYRALLLRHRLTRRPLALLVVRAQHDTLEVLDIVGATSDLPAAITALRELAKQMSLPGVTLWTTRSHAPRFEASSRDRPQLDDLAITVPAQAYVPGPRADELQGRWYLTGGDTDFR